MRRPVGPLNRRGVLGVTLLALLSWPGLRHWLEAGMWRHMVLQFPLWLLCGALLAGALGPSARATLRRWNAQGITGLVLLSVVLSVLMIPRVLDLALREPAVEVVKFCCLLLAGALVRLSWGEAGLVVQGFFLGNLLPMMAVVGQLYVDSPLRLCNAYLLDDQQRLGHWLVGAAALAAVTWLGYAMWWLVRREAIATEATAPDPDATGSPSQSPSRAQPSHPH